VTLNVNLTPQLQRLVRQKVSSGRYTSASEVVREALRLMEEKDRLSAMQLEQLRREIRDGLNSRGTGWNIEKLRRAGRRLLMESRSEARARGSK
jgi:antitoxin ParD1/3/4